MNIYNTPFNSLIFSEECHEFDTPLGTVISYIYVLRHNDLPFYFIEYVSDFKKTFNENLKLNAIRTLYSNVYNCSQYGRAVIPLNYPGMSHFIYTPEWDGFNWFVRDLTGSICYKKSEINMKAIIKNE